MKEKKKKKKKKPANAQNMMIGGPGSATVPEECVSVKRDLFIRQKRPIHTAKETFSFGKRGLFIRQKRPIHTAKEAYSYGKRGL